MSTHRLKFVSVLCALVGCYGGVENPSSTADEIRYNPYANHCWRVCRADVPCDTHCIDSEYFDSTCAAVGVCLPSTSASISASPERVEVTRGSLGYTTISWHTTGASDARIYVSVDGGPTQLFAQSPSGSQGASWIVAGHVYEFTLVPEGHTSAAASVRVEGVERPEPCGQSGQAPGASGCCAGLAACGGVCLDLSADTSNCGCCGRVCGAPANASPVCRGGGCDFECHAGFTRAGDTCVSASACGSYYQPPCAGRCNPGLVASGGQCVTAPAVDPCANVHCPWRYVCIDGLCEPIGGSYPPPQPL